MSSHCIASKRQWVAGLLALLAALFLAACQPRTVIDYSGPVAAWDEATGSKGGGQYSPLTQITRDNIHRLKVAWTYAPGSGGGGSAGKPVGSDTHASVVVEVTPIIADGKLVLCTPKHEVIALDAETGRELWRHDPGIDHGNWLMKCRGVASWSEPLVEEDKPCQHRILSTSGDGRLFALDLDNGQLCRDFGGAGEISMLEGLGPVKRGEYGNTSPPLIFKDLVVVGPGVRDGFREDAPSGAVRAWDVRSGKLAWVWDPVGPDMQPVTAEDLAAGKTLTRGTPDAWGYLSADVENGLIYVPTGHAPNDHYKGKPRAIDHYGSSVVALDAATGKVVWHFQTVHHDIWDYDVGAQPVLYEHRGSIPAVAISTKLGHVFLLNRLTGEPLFPIEQRPVPASDIPGEFVAPTQPFPTLPRPVFSDRLTEDDLIGYPVYSRGCREKFTAVRNEGPFTPPSLRGSLMRPGISGGFNWGSGSIDPQSRTMVATYLDMPFIVKLVPRPENGDAETDDLPFNFMQAPQYGAPYTFYRVPFLSEKHIPCVKPPWGAILAIDLDSGKELWRKPLGSLHGRVPLIGSMLKVGTLVTGGTLQTASGLVFVGASADEHFRVFDAQSGKELWSTRLPFSAHATPMTYRLRPDSKQFVVIATGGSASMNTKAGDELVAFSLPD